MVNLPKVDSKVMSLKSLLEKVRLEKEDIDHLYLKNDGRYLSNLVECLLIRLPLPVLYFTWDSDNEGYYICQLGSWNVLSALKLFINGTEELYSSRFLLDLNGKTYTELPEHLQRRILETNFEVKLLEKGQDKRMYSSDRSDYISVEDVALGMLTELYY